MDREQHWRLQRLLTQARQSQGRGANAPLLRSHLTQTPTTYLQSLSAISEHQNSSFMARHGLPIGNVIVILPRVALILGDDLFESEVQLFLRIG